MMAEETPLKVESTRRFQRQRQVARGNEWTTKSSERIYGNLNS